MFTVKGTIDVRAVHECLIIGVFDKSYRFNEELIKLDHHFNGKLIRLIHNGEISVKRKKLTPIHTFEMIGSKKILFVGLGKEKTFSYEILRESLGKVFQQLKEEKLQHVAIYLDSFLANELEILDVSHAIGETIGLSTYEFEGYKHKTNEKENQIETITIYSTSTDNLEIYTALNIGYVYGNATNSARTLVNLPGNMLTATDMANYAADLSRKYMFELEILEKEDMLKLGMGAMLAVNKGSMEPPKMIVLKYQGKEEWVDVIGLVGKGVTFDTGGYSIKSKDGIVGMKTDMGGAAAVLGAMEIIGELKPEQNVVAVIPATDNMISGGALKPDDVIISLSGKTIEVLNTDAEGRLVLADAVTYAKQHGANYLVDVATLTGGVIVALGTEITGAITNNQALYELVREAAEEAIEPIWQLPLFEKHKKRVRNSQIADLNNSPGREGHAIMGGAFIGEFTETTPWVHLDIAGTATSKIPSNLGPAGATGVMVRTLALFVERFTPFKK